MTVFTREDYRFMARAIQLGEKGLYSTSPNPRVGCVIVKEGRTIGEGWHIRPGEGHAEVNAIASCSESTEGATAYVSLEPCSHFGKTPPCAEALVNAKVARVVAAMEDPNPKVSGNGFARLEAAGIDVSHGLMAIEAARLNPGFIRRCEGGKPYVRIKLASSIDGRIAMASGESQWITGPAARQDVQKLRARSGAIVTGAETVRVDNPALNVRVSEVEGSVRSDLQYFHTQPCRVVVSQSGRVPADAKIWQAEGDAYLVTPKEATVDNSLANWHVPLESSAEGKLAPKAILDFVASKDINEVLIESGGKLAGAFIEAGLCDELWLYMAPVIMGATAKASVGVNIESMKDKFSLALQDVRKIGNDMRMIYTL